MATPAPAAAQQPDDKNGKDATDGGFLDWTQLLAFFGYAYLLRVPVLLFAAVAFLTLAGLFHGPGESLFGGIYDVAWLGGSGAEEAAYTILRFVVLTVITLVFGTALTISTRNIADAGEVRFRLPGIPSTRGVRLAYAFLPCLLCTVILIGVVCRASRWGFAAGGVFIGCLIFLLLIGVFQLTSAAIRRLGLVFVAAVLGVGVVGAARDVMNPLAALLLAIILAAAILARMFPVVEIFWNRVLSHIPCDGAGYFEPPNGPGRRLLSRHVAAAKQFTVALVVYGLFFLLKYRVTNARAFGRFPVLPTLAMVLVLATLVCWFLSGISFFLDRYRVPILIPLVLYAIVTSGFPQSDHFYRAIPVSAPTTKLPASKLLAWGQDKPPIVLVASTGGGIQAAAWMTRVLRGLEQATQTPVASTAHANRYDLARSIRLISSVSGGSVGTIDFLSTYIPSNEAGDGACTTRVTEQNLANDCVVAASQASSLDEVAFGLAYQDLFLNLFPFLKGLDVEIRDGKPRLFLVNGRFVLADRGANLEESLKRLSGTSRATLNQWEKLAAAGQMPAAILNATIAETGERLLLATTEIEKADSYEDNPVRGRVNFHDRYSKYDVEVATAARLSATFPYVSPAARIFHGDVYESANHVIDGGYSDNYGVASLVEWLDSGLHALENTKMLPKRVLILQIRSSPSTTPEKEQSNRGFLFQLYHPIAALYNVRETGQFSHDQTEVNLLRERWNGRTEICSVPFEYPAAQNEVEPLSWHLTEANIDALDGAWQGFQSGEKRGAVEKVIDFLKGGDTPCEK
ncbi:MAG: patatin-like phospholipase family protein [Bryobacteraceae bacterium]